MRLLMLASYFHPEATPGAIRSYEHARRWSAAGANVTVITAAPHFPTARVFEGYKNRLYQIETLDGIRILRVWTIISANTGFFRRTLGFISYAISATIAGLFVRADVVMATSPHFFVPLAGAVLGFLKHRPWVFEVRDLWPEAIKAVDMMRPGLAFRILEWLELRMYASARAIVIVSEAFRAKLVDRGVESDKIYYVPNGFDVEMLTGSPRTDVTREKYGLSGKFVIGYIGTHGLSHALQFVVANASRLASRGMAFLFLGDGAQKAELVGQAEKLGATNVVFLDPVPRADVADIWRLVDVALVNLARNPTFLSVLPSKIFEAAAMEKPILLGVGGEARRLVEHYDAGVCFAPEDADGFVEACERIAGDPILYKKLQAGCRNLAHDFDRDVLAQKMLAILRDVADAEIQKRPS